MFHNSCFSGVQYNTLYMYNVHYITLFTLFGWLLLFGSLNMCVCVYLSCPDRQKNHFFSHKLHTSHTDIANLYTDDDFIGGFLDFYSSN